MADGDLTSTATDQQFVASEFSNGCSTIPTDGLNTKYCAIHPQVSKILSASAALFSATLILS